MQFALSTNWCSQRLESGEAIADKALELGFDALELGFRTTPGQAEGFRRALGRSCFLRSLLRQSLLLSLREASLAEALLAAVLDQFCLCLFEDSFNCYDRFTAGCHHYCMITRFQLPAA